MSERRHGRHPYFFLVILACVLFAGLFYPFAIRSLYLYGNAQRRSGWGMSFRGPAWVVTTVAPDGPAAGKLEPGDRILAVNDDPRPADILSILRKLPPRSPYSVTVERAGQRRRLELSIEQRPGWRWDRLVFLLVSLLFLGCGALVGLLKPEDLRARLISATNILVAGSVLVDLLGYASYRFHGWENWIYLAMSAFRGWQFPVGYHAFSRFPTGACPGRFWILIQYFVYAAAFPLWLAALLVSLPLSPGAGGFTGWLNGDPARLAALLRLTGLVPSYLTITMILTLLVTGRNFLRLHEPGDRRRVRWVVFSFVVAALPWLIWMLAYFAFHAVSGDLYERVYPFLFLPVLAVPVSMSYAVVADQLFDIHVVIRRGVQYLLARNALRILVLAPILGLLSTVLVNRDRTLGEILTGSGAWFNLLLAAGLAASLKYRRPLQLWLDRKFFREAFQQERILLDLIDQIKEQDSMPGIAPLAAAQVEKALHPESFHLFYLEQQTSHMLSGSVQDLRISADHAVLRIMDGIKSAQDFPFVFETAMPRSEKQWLGELGVRLIVPVIGSRDRLVGLLMLGAKKSDEPYSRTDRDLLQAIAGQIGIVYENLWLQQKVGREDKIKREVLARLDSRQIKLLKECPRCGACYDSAVLNCQADGESLTMTLPVERTLDGKYRLDRLLGRGGMGAVYQAADLRLDRDVAAKILMGSLFGNQSALRRFEREARAAARLDHPNLTRVFDYGTIGADGAYLVMELLRGSTWRAELERLGTVPPQRALVWFSQLLDGLEAAHRAGIVHRDLKPENVMIAAAAGNTELVKIMDFGLARIAPEGGATETVTAAGTVMGTLGYLAPEQLGGAADARADIFALGVMLVETLTGARPFTGRTQQELFASLLHASYHLPGDSAPVRELDAVVQRSIAKSPEERFATVAEMREALLRHLQNSANESPLVKNGG